MRIRRKNERRRRKNDDDDKNERRTMMMITKKDKNDNDNTLHTFINPIIINPIINLPDYQHDKDELKKTIE